MNIFAPDTNSSIPATFTPHDFCLSSGTCHLTDSILNLAVKESFTHLTNAFDKASEQACLLTNDLHQSAQTLINQAPEAIQHAVEYAPFVGAAVGIGLASQGFLNLFNLNMTKTHVVRQIVAGSMLAGSVYLEGDNTWKLMQTTGVFLGAFILWKNTPSEPTSSSSSQHTSTSTNTDIKQKANPFLPKALKK
jgi:hypothetical protein